MMWLVSASLVPLLKAKKILMKEGNHVFFFPEHHAWLYMTLTTIDVYNKKPLCFFLFR